MRQENIIRNIIPTLKDLSIPDILGNFKNERDYLNTIEILSSSTKEYIHRLNYIKSNVFPNIENHVNFLDIGPGNGALTQEIMKKFKNITLVDTNKEVLNNIELKKLIPKKLINPFWMYH